MCCVDLTYNYVLETSRKITSNDRKGQVAWEGAKRKCSAEACQPNLWKRVVDEKLVKISKYRVS